MPKWHDLYLTKKQMSPKGHIYVAESQGDNRCSICGQLPSCHDNQKVVSHDELVVDVVL
jgi:hypothetical protein